MGLGTFVSVIAQECLVADALTKVAMAWGRKADGMLRRFGATAYLHDSRGNWHLVGAGS